MTELFTRDEAPPEMVDRILAELEPLVARQRRAVAQAGCFRNISGTQLHVLFLLMSKGSLPMTRLAEHLDVSLPNVTGIIERMVERDLIERTRSDEDRRVVAVAPTKLGRETVHEIDMIRREQLAAIVKHLTPVQQERVLLAATDLRGAIEALETAEEQEAQRAPGDAA